MPSCNAEGSSCPLLGRMTIYVNQMFTSLLSKIKIKHPNYVWFNLNLLNHNSAKVCHLQAAVAHLENFMPIWHTWCLLLLKLSIWQPSSMPSSIPPFVSWKERPQVVSWTIITGILNSPPKVHESYIIVLPPSRLNRVPYLFHLSTTQSGYAETTTCYLIPWGPCSKVMP